MFRSPKLAQQPPTSQPLRRHLPPSIQRATTYPSSDLFFRLARRDFTLLAKSSFLLLLTSQGQPGFPLPPAIAEDSNSNSGGCAGKSPSKRAFLDVSIDGKPIGRIVVGLYADDVPAGASRFADLVTGAAGITYRRKEFVRITPNYVQHSGVRSYGVDAEFARRSGGSLAPENLIREWERENENCGGKVRNVAGSVGIIVRDPAKPAPKVKLVAREGKLEIEEEETRPDPNGTEFVMAVKDSPELDASALVVGRVVGGMEVVERIGQVKSVKENTSSPYFRVAKLIGDTRAVVAERGFNRPYSKVVVTNCGLLE